MSTFTNDKALRTLCEYLKKLEVSWREKFPNSRYISVQFAFNFRKYDLHWDKKIVLAQEVGTDYTAILTSGGFTETYFSEILLKKLAVELERLYEKLIEDNSLQLPQELLKVFERII